MQLLQCWKMHSQSPNAWHLHLKGIQIDLSHCKHHSNPDALAFPTKTFIASEQHRLGLPWRLTSPHHRGLLQSRPQPAQVGICAACLITSSRNQEEETIRFIIFSQLAFFRVMYHPYLKIEPFLINIPSKCWEALLSSPYYIKSLPYVGSITECFRKTVNYTYFLHSR